MKKLILPLALLILSIVSRSQQVAINTDGSAITDPRAMVEIKKGGYSKLKIRSLNYGDSAVLELSNRNNLAQGTDFLVTAVREQGLFFTTASDLTLNRNDSLFTVLTSGNIGIGTRSPLSALHVHDPGSANSHLRFTHNATGTGTLDGMRIGLTGNSAVISNMENSNMLFATNNINRMAIDATGNVGIGTTAPTDKLDVAGNINLSGILKVNGSAGTAGQVLTSNGTSDPQWKNAAYNNNTRFCFVMYESGVGGPVNFSGTRYNLNSADVVRNPSSITINKTGLYHFDVNLNIFIDYDAGTTIDPFCYLSLSADGDLYEILQGKTIPGESNSSDHRYTQLFSIDLHITAPSTITLPYELYLFGSPVGRFVQGQFAGYLISE